MSNILSNFEHILASAQKLIVSGGYNGFSYADISEIVGIRKASIHHHFPTKVDLVLALVKRYRQDAETAFDMLERNVTDPIEQLQAFIGHWAECIEEGSRPFCVCALLASELPLLPSDVAIEVKAYFHLLSGWLTRVFERASKEGLIHLRHTPRDEAELFMAVIHGAMLSARTYGDAGKFSMIASAALDHVKVAKLTTQQ
ncbi:TetR/AcrR family transcriptional regulator [Rhizobium sp. TRM95796]|uniref:TetR/AcrR family transcriptional regulator n=1 Tax=Rhizobium sp. TRM95796 TaxID=2979862 RepID=UPI0021E85392|nr:TetR/AcrR family transcriptional regulator [Rhizobium sp. TRM95796]MCV3764969.1 TetR/AcrR family transcriptional regulator [Rhizobium sp. TRM95796]